MWPNCFLVTLGDNPEEHQCLPWCSGFGWRAQGRVRWCNEVGHGEKEIKQNGRWRQTRIQWPGIDRQTFRNLTQPPGPQMKNAGSLFQMEPFHTLETPWDTTHTQRPAQFSAPTVCSEWNQWAPKGSGVDFYVNSLCLKVKWGKGRHTEENIAERRRTEQRGMEERVLERKRQVSWHRQNCGALLPRKWKARVCSSKGICMAWWALLW